MIESYYFVTPYKCCPMMCPLHTTISRFQWASSTPAVLRLFRNVSGGDHTAISATQKLEPTGSLVGWLVGTSLGWGPAQRIYAKRKSMDGKIFLVFF